MTFLPCKQGPIWSFTQVHHKQPNEKQDKSISRSEAEVAMEVVRQEREASFPSLHFTEREVGHKETTQKEKAVNREECIANGLE